MNKLLFIKTLKPEIFFLWAAICFHCLFNLITPPLQSPDEFNHLYRAVNISNGHFFPEKEDNRLGGKIQFCFKEFAIPYYLTRYNINYKLSKDDIFQSFKVNYKDTLDEFRDFPNTTVYSPVSYFPHVLGIFIFKTLGCSVGVLYYAGRIFSFLFWMLCMYHVIKLLPVFKWLFTLLMLLPMSVYVTGSFSADTVTNCLAWLFIAYTLNILFCKEKVSRKDIAVLASLLMLLALSKVVYVGLIVLLFLLPRKKFSSTLQYCLSLLLLFSFAFITALAWSKVVMHYYTSFSEYNPNHDFNYTLSSCANYYLQKEYILTHRFYFLKVIWNSLFNHPAYHLTTYVGVSGQGDIGLPHWLYFLAYTVILYLALTEKNNFSFTLYHKVVLFCAASCAFVLLLLSLHLTWDCVGEGVVDLLQGRYLVPIFPLLFFMFDNTLIKTKLNPLAVIIPFLILIYAASVNTILQRYYIDNLTKKISYSCDAETDDRNGSFITSNPKVKIDGAWLKTENEHHSGNYSMALSPQYPYGFAYKLNELHYDDLIEIEAWLKGDSTFIVLGGEGKKCGNFYMAATEKTLPDKNGWRKLRTVITFPIHCDSVQAGVYIWNASKSQVYVDDMKFSIKK